MAKGLFPKHKKIYEVKEWKEWQEGLEMKYTFEYWKTDKWLPWAGYIVGDGNCGYYYAHNILTLSFPKYQHRK